MKEEGKVVKMEDLINIDRNINEENKEYYRYYEKKE